ncbi:hypothetical protein [Microbacterium invictum]|uniref:Uncharacterized protein n=1 Tax=Microbacterium invictum TaxID=515415 RepID=A0AA40SPR3_9MICO|nr:MULTISPECIES: hypothetical protein [Microbacterium]MBB4140155.1 hypothetical protein [Microbacterium invictum]
MTGPGVRPPVAAALATVGFFALLVAVLGMTSLFLEQDVIATEGLGNLPGATAAGLATVAVLGVLLVTLRRPNPSYWIAAVVTLAAVLAYLVGLWFGAVFAGEDPVLAASAAGEFLLSWFALALAVVAFIAGWVGVALVRTRADRPRWPWESDTDEP